MIEWELDCTGGTAGENMNCLVHQQGISELYAQNEILISQNANFLDDNQIIIDNLNHISFFIFIMIVFSVLLLIVRWLFRLVSELILGF